MRTLSSADRVPYTATTGEGVGPVRATLADDGS